MVLKATIIVPAYNEQDNIKDVLDDIFSSVTYKNFDVMVIDDGSTDRTKEVCESLDYLNLKIMINEKNMGKTLSILKAVNLCGSDIVAFIDGDNQFYAKDLNRILELIDNNDIVCGRIISKYDSFHRKFMSWGFNTFNRIVFGIRINDVNCGMKAFKVAAFKRLRIRYLEARWFIDTEMLARAYHSKLKITEVGIYHKQRMKGESKVNTLKLTIETIIYALKLKWELLLLRGRPGN